MPVGCPFSAGPPLWLWTVALALIVMWVLSPRLIAVPLLSKVPSVVPSPTVTVVIVVPPADGPMTPSPLFVGTVHVTLPALRAHAACASVAPIATIKAVIDTPIFPRVRLLFGKGKRAQAAILRDDVPRLLLVCMWSRPVHQQ